MTAETIPLIWAAPFAGLLLSIAILPLAAPHFWESNVKKAWLAAAFGLPVAIYVRLHQPGEILHVSVEYFSFISLLAALFIISGGILVDGDIQGKPSTNAFILLLGALLSNLIGTTGASMLLIRTVLRINHERKNVKHIPIFFIFLVSNIGGSLLPIGDPPLFLGYLEGVPFFWTLKLFPIWALAVGLVLLVFYIVDTRAYRAEPELNILLDKAIIEPIQVRGLSNFLWLLAILLSAIFLRTPVREIVMIAAALLSWFTTPKENHEKNRFTFNPIIEVGILFAGIFAAMIPCLMILKARGGSLGVIRPWQFFWASGTLSSFLDNAPTYLTYLSLAQGVTQGLGLPGGILLRGGPVSEVLLKAISAGSVFMGANTYIGNAPNFMVKSISDDARFHAPSFFGYMLWSGAVLIPVFLIVTLVFFV